MSKQQGNLGRRAFLKLAGVGTATAAITSCHAGDPYSVAKPAVPGSGDYAQGEVKWVASACGQCDAACGVRVRVVEGRAVRVSGNPMNQINTGGLGPRGLAGPQVLYDPDRVTGPMRRLVPKGSPATGDSDWEQVSWETAIEELGEHLLELREDENGQKLCVVTGQERGTSRDILARFAESFGTTNFLDGASKGEFPDAIAGLLMQGVSEVPVPDWKSAQLVVSLGSEVLQVSCKSQHLARTSARGGRRARVVHVGAAHTSTARQADAFLQIRTGTFGAFALGLAHVIVAADLHDREFLAEHCLGFEDWEDASGETHSGLRTALDEYSPAVVEEITGVSAESIEALGTELGEAHSTFVVAGSEAYQSANGVTSAMCVRALNAILGAIDRPGGVLTQRFAPLAEWDEVEPDEYAEETLENAPIWADSANAPLAMDLVGAPVDLLPAALLANKGSIDTLLLHYSNPLWSRPEAKRWEEALVDIPVVVSFSPFWDETSLAVADWILPDHSYLERWEDAGPSPSVGFPVFSLRQPVVKPLHDTRQTVDVILDLARIIDEGVLEALPWKNAKDVVKKQIIGIYAAKRGSIIESKGSKFLSAFYAAGGWHDSEYNFEDWDEVLKTSSGKFEFASQQLFEMLSAAGRPDAAALCMPHHAPLVAEGDAERFPLLLVPFRPSTYAEGSGANLPLLQELRLHPADRPWRTQVLLHPKTAEVFGVADGDPVVVAGLRGELEAYARIDDGVQRGELRFPRGHGHTAMGRFASGWGANVSDLVGIPNNDSIFGTTPWIGTRVSITRSQA